MLPRDRAQEQEQPDLGPRRIYSQYEVATGRNAILGTIAMPFGVLNLAIGREDENGYLRHSKLSISGAIPGQ